MSSSSSETVDRRLPRSKYDSSSSSVWVEIQAVLVGVMGSFLLRTAISQLFTYNKTSISDSPPPFWLRNYVCADKNPLDDAAVCSTLTSTAATAVVGIWNMLSAVGSIVTRIILWFLPHTQSNNTNDVPVIAVGFSFANFWMLLWIRHYWQCYASLPVRLCETVMGRLSWKRFCFLVVPIHIIGTMVLAWSYQTLLEQLSTMMITSSLSSELSWSKLAFAPVVYASDTHWWKLLLRECFVTTFFIMSLLVLPELLRVNRLPIWPCGFILYKLYSYGLDTRRQPSTFQPVVLVVFAWLAAIKQHPNDWNKKFDWIMVIAPNLIGSLLGGWVAGYSMRKCFPDGNSRR